MALGFDSRGGGVENNGKILRNISSKNVKRNLLNKYYFIVNHLFIGTWTAFHSILNDIDYYKFDLFYLFLNILRRQIYDKVIWDSDLTYLLIRMKVSHKIDATIVVHLRKKRERFQIYSQS